MEFDDEHLHVMHAEQNIPLVKTADFDVPLTSENGRQLNWYFSFLTNFMSLVSFYAP